MREGAARARTIVLEASGWPGHRAGQHLDVRLRAEDGYEAQRAYSVSSPPGEPPAITVELLADGEVSSYLVEEPRPRDALEIRGPLGGHFVWEAATARAPLLLVAGGSGLVPLMAMARHRAEAGSAVPARLLVAARSLEDLLFAELSELGARGDGLEVLVTLTRTKPPGWSGYARRVDTDLLRESRGHRRKRRTRSSAARPRSSRWWRAAWSSSATTPGASGRNDSGRPEEAEVRTEELRLDGNALGGLLLDVFGVDMTAAWATCGSCAVHAELAQVDVYVRCPGTVARCRACGAVLLRLVEGPDRIWLDLGGIRSLELPRGATPPA